MPTKSGNLSVSAQEAIKTSRNRLSSHWISPITLMLKRSSPLAAKKLPISSIIVQFLGIIRRASEAEQAISQTTFKCLQNKLNDTQAESVYETEVGIIESQLLC
jgi:hypothetical protein